ncbi:MAG: alkylation response protein AidB-like acyl-CoA dehydrogenase [Gammaproteobacteria bacterium]
MAQSQQQDKQMQTYTPPLRDIRFVLNEVLNAQECFAQLDGFEEVNEELINTVLEEAGKLFEEVVFPTNTVGHLEGCKLENGTVKTPTGFKDAYKAFADGGWLALSAEPEYGGQGLPETLTFVLDEMFTSANMALSLYVVLTHGAYLAVRTHASDEIKQTFLPKMISGEWTGTMCLTEPHAGTDLGLLRSRAEPNDDGSYAVSGTKIFISAGEHDMVDNIVHLVLARLPDAPAGVKGISLFVVPKFHAEADGTIGARNSLECVSIEEKMGIKGVPACVMSFDGAKGFLVGEPHSGLKNMFTMMNHERLAVGIEGIGIAETAYQSAVAYARDRVQGRSPNGAVAPHKSADPIIVHPDVRRMLLTTRAYTEGSRALASWVAMKIDVAHKHPDASERRRADDAVQLLTPVLKAFFTDIGSERANECLQVFGGAGYVADSGMEQLVRDARIAQIYEGTNGVQANDLVGRKLFMNDGQLIKDFFADAKEFVAQREDNEALAEFLAPFITGLARLEDVTQWLTNASSRNREELGAASVDYLRLMGMVCMARMWVSMAEVALANEAEDNTGFYAAKVSTARFFMRRLMPQTGALAEAIRSGADTLMALEAQAY